MVAGSWAGSVVGRIRIRFRCGRVVGRSCVLYGLYAPVGVGGCACGMMVWCVSKE